MDAEDQDAVEAALDRLPVAHALALRLRSSGVSDEELCRRLGIEPEGLDMLLLVASLKLAKELG